MDPIKNVVFLQSDIYKEDIKGSDSFGTFRM